jgi:shikimate dehydrogenase
MYLALQFLLAPFLFPKTEISLDIPFNALGKEHLVIDLIYNPEKTLFIEHAQKQQATILNGASILKE